MPDSNCKNCGDSFIQYNSLQNLCSPCLADKAKHITKKDRHTIRPHGRVTKQWLQEDRPKWIKNNPASHEGYWECYLQLNKGCRRFMTIETLTIDHVASRSRYPSKRRKQQNLKPACRPCNNLKGSLSLDRIKKLYPQSKVALGKRSVPRS